MIIDFRYIARSGSHAIMNWCAHLFDSDVYLMNACEIDGTCHFGENDQLWSSPVKYKYANAVDAGRVMFRSFESWKATRSVDTSIVQDIDIYIIRSPKTLFASLIRNREQKGEDPAVLIDLELHKHYNILAGEAMRDYTIHYDEWAGSSYEAKQYRQKKGNELRDVFTDSGFIVDVSQGWVCPDIHQVVPNTGGMPTGFSSGEDRVALYQDNEVWKFLVNETTEAYNRFLAVH